MASTTQPLNDEAINKALRLAVEDYLEVNWDPTPDWTVEKDAYLAWYDALKYAVLARKMETLDWRISRDALKAKILDKLLQIQPELKPIARQIRNNLVPAMKDEETI